MSRHNRERRRLRREEKAARGPEPAPEPKEEHPPVRYNPLVSVAGNPLSRGIPQPVFIRPRFKSGSLWFTPSVACR